MSAHSRTQACLGSRYQWHLRRSSFDVLGRAQVQNFASRNGVTLCRCSAPRAKTRPKKRIGIETWAAPDARLIFASLNSGSVSMALFSGQRAGSRSSVRAYVPVQDLRMKNC